MREIVNVNTVDVIETKHKMEALINDNFNTIKEYLQLEEKIHPIANKILFDIYRNGTTDEYRTLVKYNIYLDNGHIENYKVLDKEVNLHYSIYNCV